VTDIWNGNSPVVLFECGGHML